MWAYVKVWGLREVSGVFFITTASKHWSGMSDKDLASTLLAESELINPICVLEHRTFYIRYGMPDELPEAA